MRKRMAAQAELSSIQSAQSPNIHASDNKKTSLVGDVKVIVMAKRMQHQPPKKTKQCTIVLSDKDTIRPSVRVPTKCATLKKIKILSETLMGMVTMKESKKGKEGMKEANAKAKETLLT